MSVPSPKKSPFKALAFKNQTHCGYISMSQLEPNKPYIMYEMRATHHATYGDGLLSFLRGKNNSQWRSQFPPKYLQNFTAEDIEALRDQINQKKFPIVIFREVLADKSFKIDLAPYSEEMANAHRLWQDVGAIVLSPDTSLEERDETPKNTETSNDDKEMELNSTSTENGNGNPIKRKLDDDSPDDYLTQLFQMWNTNSHTANKEESIDQLAAEVHDLLEANKSYNYEDDISIYLSASSTQDDFDSGDLAAENSFALDNDNPADVSSNITQDGLQTGDIACTSLDTETTEQLFKTCLSDD